MSQLACPWDATDTMDEVDIFVFANLVVFAFVFAAVFVDVVVVEILSIPAICSKRVPTEGHALTYLDERGAVEK